MRTLLVSAVLAFAAQLAQAADAGKIIFVAGKASVGERPAAEGAMVAEGELLSTGADGFIYIKTADNGLFILRPETRARIAAYHVDRSNPANTRVKLELLSGTARSKSGDAVKMARQNFRFNTPVAAIGVRGTDFTVFTDSNTSRVAVLSGGVVVSGFGGSCSPDGIGPCEGGASRELSAAQRGMLLQVQRGQAAPQVLQGGSQAPDLLSPPRPDEPLAKAGNTAPAAAAVVLEANKQATLTTALEKAAPPPPPPVLAPPQKENVPSVPGSTFVWGRWQPVNGILPTLDLSAERAQSELLAVNGNFALFRTTGASYVSPNSGNIGFTLRGSEAYVITDYGYGNVMIAPATLQNGSLTVDFGRRAFATSMDLISATDVTRLHAEGMVTSDGRLYGDAANGRPGYINVQGLLSTERNGAAATIFDGRLDQLRTVNGAATWR